MTASAQIRVPTIDQPTLGETVDTATAILQVIGAVANAANDDPTDVTSTATHTAYFKGLLKTLGKIGDSAWVTGNGTLGALLKAIAQRQAVMTIPLIVTAGAMTRPANTTAVVAGGSVSDNETAASVGPHSFTFSDTNDAPVDVESIRLMSTDTGIKNTSVRLHLFRSDPTAGGGVQAGNHVAYNQKQAGWIGSFVGLMLGFNDGSAGILTPEAGLRIRDLPGTGAKTLWWQLQSIDGFTPSANSTSFTPTFKGLQGRAT